MTQSPSDGESKAHKESFVRWQGITITQLGYVVNFILGMAIAALGFSFNLVKDKEFAPGFWARGCFALSMFILLASVVCGLLCVINRLCDFRQTERIARIRKNWWHRHDATEGKVERVLRRIRPLKRHTRALGRRTWTLLYWQFGLFALGVLVMSLTIAYLLLRPPADKHQVAMETPTAKETDRPKPPEPWNVNAITAKFDRLKFGEWNLSELETEFFYIFENHTDFDYETPATAKIMRLLAENNSLEMCGGSGVQKLLIPAHHRVKAWVNCPIHYSEIFSRKDLGNKKKVAGFIATELKNTSAFVLFDEATRYEINLPSGWQNIHSSYK